MVEIIGEAAALEMLAEECTELAHAALKLSRIIRDENPTPVSTSHARSDVMEEWADVLLCSEYLDELTWFRPDMVDQCIRIKKRRAKERIRNGQIG